MAVWEAIISKLSGVHRPLFFFAASEIAAPHLELLQINEDFTIFMVTSSSVPIQFCIHFRDSAAPACLLGLMQ